MGLWSHHFWCLRHHQDWPLVNVLAAGVNNSFALLDIADCTDHLSNGGEKDAMHIAKIIMPLIELIKSELDVHNKKSSGIIDLVFLWSK